MCGIAGMMQRSGGAAPPLGGLLDNLADRLAHRGPDGRGHHAKSGVGLVQTRLAIIDLVTGDQPLFEPGGAALVANGEIYNYVELRAAMAEVAFATQSDCEPALHLFRARGLDFTEALRGMYAIALHDPANGRLVLARDPFGIKPLYYVERDDGLAFASEPRALIGAGLASRTLHAATRDEFLQLRFTTGRDTMFEGIKRVLPGETVVVVDGRIIERRRSAALPDGGPLPQDEDAALDAIDAALADSVRVHCRSDVPYGLFLSGGVDSSLVLSYMAEHANVPVLSFAVGFEGGPGVNRVADERAVARAAARQFRAEHVEIGFGEKDCWRLLPQVAAAMDDPAADYACLPTYKLAQAARAAVKVVLTGEGGDELFAGYGRYRSAMRPWWLGGRATWSKGTFDKLRILRGDGTRGGAAWRDGIAAAEVTAGGDGRSRLQAAQAVDCDTWLPNDLLTKLDRCLMAHGLEGRTPFLDPAVAGAAFRLPDRHKIRGGLGKHLLRRLLARRLPGAEAFAPKRGFTVPVVDWIAGQGKRLGELVARQPGIAEIADPARVEALFQATGKQVGFAAWTLLFYALWHRAHALGLPSDGDAFDCLAATPRGV
ncbi:MAG: asparagine synthase (glutamine-hydrolyzing) [Alphaproteobacteria bacterium]|nr:asparagine synthase (glutamine-hydrolyzing) [Alphaproteobacteria bacterium]